MCSIKPCIISLMQCQINSYTYDFCVTYIASAIGMTLARINRSIIMTKSETFYKLSLQMHSITQCQSIELPSVTTLQV
jgi:hypothetical protein